MYASRSLLVQEKNLGKKKKKMRSAKLERITPGWDPPAYQGKKLGWEKRYATTNRCAWPK